MRTVGAMLASFFVVLGSLGPIPASAAVAPFSAKELIRSARALDMAVGESATFTITFKNTGTKTWVKDGKNFVSVYTYGPKYRKSAFADSSWMSDVQVARMKEDRAAPGNTATFAFTMFAPLEPGDYVETFVLAAEDAAWVTGGQFTVDATVRRAKVAAGSSMSGTTIYKAPGYKAAKMLVSERALSLAGGSSKEFRVAFKNVGKQSWTKSGASSVALRLASGTPQLFRHSSWSGDVATGLPSDEVKPGQLAFFTFTLSAPILGGQYVPKFMLAAGDDMVEGGEVEIPMEVRQGTLPAQVPATGSEIAASGPRGPNIRVGLFATTGPVTIAAAGSYWLMNGDHERVRQLSGVTTTTFDFGTLVYTVRNGDYAYTAAKHVHFVPDDPAQTIFEIQSHENRPTWDPTLNFNKFRGGLEVFYSRTTGRMWVIEELPIEDYMRGLAETTNASPYEFQKALVTAARTYALFVQSIGGKHKSEFFDVDTTGNDQVYKGYVSELVRPNVVRAVEETRGSVVTYGGELVVTPYFSRSDGRTRAWTEVWGSSHKPWLVSKVAPYDQGKTLWGHGVGMSASDAVGRANDGASWTDILQYYYTGIELKRLY